MYRRNCLQGWCILVFGLGMIVGHCLESWLLCCGGGLGLVFFGLCVMRKK